MDVMQAEASALTKQQVKVLIEKEIDTCWSLVQRALGFRTKEQAYAFFLGMASRESTLNAGLETGSGPSHSFDAAMRSDSLCYS
jgi:Cel124 C-terminal catalytic domain